MGRNGGGDECCMCGDHGLSSELFTCQKCGFRSQHKYCSNLYPGAESYTNCNWCLTKKDEKKGEDQITKISSRNSTHKTKSDHHEVVKTVKKNKKDVHVNNEDGIRLAVDHQHSQIKKQSKFPAPPSSAGRKRVTGDGDGGGAIKRSRAEEMCSNGGVMMKKPVFRNKVRRYKLLDEVSS